MFRLAHLFLLVSVVVRAEILPLWSTSLLDDVSDDTVPLRFTGHAPRLFSNCERSAQVYLHEYAYLSENGFTTPMSPMRIPITQLHVDDPIVESVVVRSDSIALLIEGKVYVYDLQMSQYWVANISDGYVATGLEFSRFCCKYSWCQDYSDAVLAVGETEDPVEGHTNKIFILEKGETEFRGTPLPGAVEDLELLAAVPVLPWHSVALLMLEPNQDEHTQDASFHYLHIPFKGRNPEKNDTHTEEAMRAVTYSHQGSALRVVHLTNRFGEFLVWGPRELFTSKTAGQSVFRASEEIKEHIDHDDFIQELTAGPNGDFAFLTSEGRLFYGRSNLETHIAELRVGSLVNSESALLFDQHSNLFIMNAKHYELDSRDYSTESLVYLDATLIYPSEIIQRQSIDGQTCPFLLFTAQFGSDFMYIDIGQSLVLKALFIPGLWHDGSVMVYPSNPSILTVNSTITAGDPIGSGLKRMQVSANVSLTGDREDAKDGEYNDGLSTVTFTTAQPSLTCLPNPSVQAYVLAGCPPGKNIRLRKQFQRTSCEYLKNYIYTFERDEYDPTFMEGTNGIDEDQGVLSIQYDYGRHGCPDRSFFSDGYRPQFDLYMDNEYIEPMDADYAVIEIHGVHNYKYHFTTKQAGCTRRPQSWIEMLELQNTTRDPTTAWTRYNYNDCVEENRTKTSARLPYQVMNRNSRNKIIWREKKAIYVFNVTVLDPKYSYCNLQTQFAVEVYGALPDTAVSPIRVMLITCALGFAGVIFIFIYYLLQMKDAEEEKQQTQRIPQFPH